MGAPRLNNFQLKVPVRVRDDVRHPLIIVVRVAFEFFDIFLLGGAELHCRHENLTKHYCFWSHTIIVISFNCSVMKPISPVTKHILSSRVLHPCRQLARNQCLQKAGGPPLDFSSLPGISYLGKVRRRFSGLQSIQSAGVHAFVCQTCLKAASCSSQRMYIDFVCMDEEVLSLKPMIPPKRFDIFPLVWGMLKRFRCVQTFL